ncbi:MAG: apolipoprotein N-acyltransferase [Comamonadaceae bacterium]
MKPLKGPSRWPTLQQAVLAVLAGGAQAASMAWPGSDQIPTVAWLGLRHGQPVWWLQLLAVGLLAWQLKGSHSWQLAARCSWLFGTAWLAGTFGWTFVALHTYGDLPFVLAILAVLALAGLLALFYALAGGLFVALAPVGRAWSALVFAALWLLAELGRGTLLTGFGWGASGYAHVDGPLAGYAPWFGVYGLCAITAWLAMALVQLLQVGREMSANRRSTGLALALMVLGLLALPYLPPAQRTDMTQSSGNLSVTLLQGNIPQNEKFETSTGVPLALQWYAEQLQASRTSLVIAPETAVPVLPQQLPPNYWEALQQRFGDGQQAALIGTPLGSYQQGYTNSVVGLKASEAPPWRYAKRHLVPFGEFIPPFFKWFTAMMNIPLGDFNRGDLRQPPFEWQGQRVAANICYEDLFGEELAAQFKDPERVPTLFVNISNLAWFGDTLAIDQHLQIARMRALEFERAFVLATNTGATAIVDHRARITASLARNTRGTLVGSVEGRTGVTPYAWWVERFGLWPMWLLAFGLIALALRASLKNRQAHNLALHQAGSSEAP